MSFRITSIDHNGVRLVQDAETMIVPIIGTFIGSISLAVGISIYASSGPLPMSLGFGLGGFFFCIVPWLIMAQVRRTQTREIIFDNNGARVCLLGRSVPTSDFCSVPYEQLDRFVLYPSDNTVKSTSDLARFDLCLQFRDGSFIRLFVNYGTREATEELRATFERAVQLRRPSHQIVVANPSSRFECTRTHDATLVRWKSSSSSAPASLSAVGLVVFFSVFFSIVYAFSRMAIDEPFVKIVVGFIATVGVIVLIGTVVGVIRNRGTHKVLHISSEGIEYGDENENSQLEKSVHIVQSEFSHFGFFPDDLEAQQNVVLITRERAAEFEARRAEQEQAEDWKDNLALGVKSFQERVSTPTLDCGSTRLVERVSIAQFLNNERSRFATTESSELFAQAGTPSLPLFINAPALPARLLERLTRNRVLGVLCVLNVMFPVVTLILVTSLRGMSSFSSFIWLFQSINALQILIALTASWKLIQLPRLRILGYLLAIETVLYTLSLYQLFNPLALSSGLHLFILSVLLVLSGLRMLKTPEPEPVIEL